MTKKTICKALSAYPSALTVSEVAEILRVSTKTVYKLLKAGTIPSVKVGRENRIAKANLVDYLRQREKTGSNPLVISFEKSSENAWTCEKSCGSVRVAQKVNSKEGGGKRGAEKSSGRQHTA